MVTEMLKMKMTLCLSGLFVTMIVVSAGAVPPDETAEQIAVTKESVRIHRQGQQEFSYLGWSSAISDLFKVPISFEWSYVNQDRVEEETPRIQLEISPNQTLEQVLDEFCAAAGGRLQWQRIHGVIWIGPKDSEGRTESLLDVVVSLQLEDASVWDAFLELSRVINENTPQGRYIKPSANPNNDALPPLGFRNEKTVTLDLVNVTAREAAAAIMSTSAFHMKIWYTNFYRVRETNPMKPMAQLSIWAYDEHYRLLSDLRPPSREVEMRWHNEADSVVPPQTSEPVLLPTQP
jgi:hypothetical protein